MSANFLASSLEVSRDVICINKKSLQTGAHLQSCFFFVFFLSANDSCLVTNLNVSVLYLNVFRCVLLS